MIVPRYSSGDWYAVVTDGAVAMLPPDTPPAVVTDVWDSLRASESMASQVELLLRGGLRELPPFALLSVRGGSAHLIVRGGIEAVVGTDGGDRVLTGAHVATWSEEIVTDPVEVTVAVVGVALAAGELPVLSGIVRAGSVSLTLRAPAEKAPVDQADRSPAERAAARAPVASEQPMVPGPRAPAADLDPLGDLANTVLQPTSQSVAGRAALRPHAVPGIELPDPEEVEAQRGAVPPPPPERPAIIGGWLATGQPEAAARVLPGPEPARREGGHDHDGHTVLSSDVPTLRRQLPDWAGDAPPGPFAVPSPQGPPPAKIVLSTGLVVALNRTVLLGRAPQVSRVTNSDLPRLVTVASPNQDISRTHAEVRQEGERVLVTDLRSTNGVLLLREGAQPQRLHPGVATVVEPGITVDLGDGVTFLIDAR